MIIIFSIVLALLLSLWVYRGSYRRLWYLVILRTASLSLLLILIFTPIFKKSVTIPTTIDILIDKSGSMAFKEKSKFLNSAIKDLKNLKSQNFKLNFFSFDTTVYEGINLDFGGKTAIGTAINSASSKFLILLSDGINNRGPFPDTHGKKIVSLVPPSTGILIKSVRFKPLIVEGTQDTVELIPGISGNLEIFNKSRKILSKIVEKDKKYSFVLKPPANGIYTYKIKIDRKLVRKITIRVVKRGKSVLVMSSHPDVNIRFLRMYLDQNGNITTDFVVSMKRGLMLFKRDTVLKLRNLDLNSYDFYILIDPDSKAIAPLLSGRRGLIIFSRKPEILDKLLGGTFISMLRKGEIYPVWKDSTLNPIGYLWVLNRYPPDADYLVYTRMGKRQIPVLFIYHNMALLMSGDFYKISLFDLNAYAKILNAVFSRLIPEGNFFVETPVRQFETGERIPITAYAYDRFGNPIDTLFPIVKIGKKVYQMKYTGNGQYSTFVTLNDTGKFKAHVIFKGFEGVLKTENIPLDVKSNKMETATPVVNLDFLRNLGQTVNSMKDLKAILATVKPEKTSKRINLRNTWVTLLIVIILMAIEWLFRRANGIV